MWDFIRSNKFVNDTVERAGRTFVQVLAAQLLMSGAGVEILTDLALWQKAATAALAASLSVVMSALAKRFGSSEDASFLSEAK